jgi:hypothetical protein
VLTDGINTAGRLDEKRVIEIARRLGVPVFPVFPSDLQTRIFLDRDPVGDLEFLAHETGGARVSFLAPEELGRELRRVFERLRAETLVTFVPGGERSGKASWRRVEIRPKVPGIKVEGELGYFAGGG